MRNTREGLLAMFAASTIALGTYTSAAAQPESGQGAISSSVMGWWMTHAEDPETSALDLVILWRGSTGWLFRGGSVGGSGSLHLGFGVDTGVQSLWAGDRALTWTVDLSERTVTILGRSFSLADVNVILVDDADGPQGSAVVGALRINPVDSAAPLHFELALRRSPEVLRFLRCDAHLNDPAQEAIAALLCARFTGQ